MPGRFVIDIPEAWRVAYAFGGVTLASALRAIVVFCDRPDLDLVSCESTYCQAIPTGPVAIEIETLREGRQAAQYQARMWATTDPAEPVRSDLVVTAVMGRRGPGPVATAPSAYPDDAGSPLDHRPRTAPEGSNGFPRVPYHDQNELRMAVGRMPWEIDEPATSQARSLSWYRFNKSVVHNGAWPSWALAVPADMVGPAVVEAVGPMDGFFWIITMQLSIQFFEPPTTDWVLQHAVANHVGDGYGTGVCELWGEDATPAALATQCALLRPAPSAD